MNLSIQCPVSDFLFNDGGSPALGSSCWRGKVLMSSFFSQAAYYRSYLGEVNTAFSLLSEVFFLMLLLTRNLVQVQEPSSTFQSMWPI